LKKIIVSVTTDLISDQRVHKICLSLCNSGHHVTLVGRKLNNDFFLKRSYKIKRFNMFFKKGFLFYLFFNIRLFFFLLFKKCDVYFSNDLDTLLPNFLVSKIKKKPLIYDSHELFTEVPELINKKFVKSFWLYIEKKIFPRLNHVITVSEGFASFYHNKYKNSILVIRNVPFLNNDFLKKENSFKFFNYKKDQINIIYQGALNKDRGIKLMIEMMEYLNANFYLFGSGDIEEKLKKHMEQKGLSNKIFFIGRIGFEKLQHITPKFDLGLSFEEDSCLSYRYSLPNKIFDYIHAGVPVLCSNLPDVSKFIKENNVGQVLNSRDPKKIALQAREIISKKETYYKHLSITKNKFYWEQEQEKVINLFDSL